METERGILMSYGYVLYKRVKALLVLVDFAKNIGMEN